MKSVNDMELLSFLHGTLQIYLEFWHSSDPFAEYNPYVTKPSDSVQQEAKYIIAERVSLLTHIRSHQFLPNINAMDKMDELQKLNIDLISILDDSQHQCMDRLTICSPYTIKASLKQAIKLLYNLVISILAT